MAKNIEIRNSTAEFLIFMFEGKEDGIQVMYKDETIWATQKAMAQLFDVGVPAISKHLKNIFESGELDEHSVISKMETTAADGKRYQTNYYNLDAIIAVGYRVNSKKATMFRIWANRVLKEFIIKGYVMDDARLREPENFFGKDYFEEQLERIRDIRASERRFYQKITDIYSQCSADYDVESPITKEFFATVQNKLHYAVTHHTAAEIVYGRADSTKPNMGLTTWKNAPDGRILKSDVSVAKNYLDAKQIRQLERTVSGYFDYIEDLIERENTFTMEEFASSVNEFLAFRRYDILPDNGRISSKNAHAKAYAEYEIFNKTQKIESDFDKSVKKLLQ